MYRSQQDAVEAARHYDGDVRAPVHGLIYVWTFSLMIWAAIGAVILLH